MDNPYPTPFHHLVDALWRGGRESVIDDLFTPDCLIHGPMGDLAGPAAFREFYRANRTAFADIEMTIEHSLQDGDLCFARFRFRARHTGEFAGLKATGRRVSFTGNSLARLDHGRIRECWDEFDLYGLLAQLDALPGIDSA